MIRGAVRALTVAALGAATVVAVVATGGDDATFVKAEFTNVRGLLENNDVRLNGAEVGKVASIELTRRGTALVTMELDDGTPAPRADAAATVRPVDLLGDIYLSYSPGTDRRALSGSIPRAQTTNMPRLADLLLAFDPGARAGMQAMIGELSAGLERRGVDLNRAAVELRPALQAVERVMGELGSQNASLRGLITDSHRVVAQLSSRRGALEGAVSSLAATLRETAQRTTGIDRGLERTAPALGELRETTGRLSRTAERLEPLAVQLQRAAPGLAQTTDRLPAFLSSARAAIDDVHPGLAGVRALLRAGRTSFPALSTGVVKLDGVARELDSVTTTFKQLTPLISSALFEKVAGQTSEPGNQPLDPNTDPLRHYWRGAGVLSCQSFGLKIAPGCLEQLGGGTRGSRTRSAGRRSSRGVSPASPEPEPEPEPRPSPPSPAPPKVRTGIGSVDRALDDVERGLGQAGERAPTDAGTGDARGLLDFLLGP